MDLRLRDTRRNLRFSVLIAITCHVITPGLVRPAQSQSIGLFFDSAATTCSQVQEPLTMGTLHVLALLGGGVADGITAARFRIEGFPPSWFFTVQLNPATSVSEGSPFGDAFHIGFFPCQFDSSGIIRLITISYFAATSVSNLYLSVSSQVPPRPGFLCPFLVRCDAVTIVCATGGEAVINPVGPGCTVQVSEVTWSKIRQLYREAGLD